MKNLILNKMCVATTILLAFIVSYNIMFDKRQFDTTLDDMANIAMASGESGSEVECFCGSTIGFGKGCKADNGGKKCNGGSDCWNYDRNCSR